jgi:hypothetical protein
VVADDVGPSLNWATAQVTRNERSEVRRGEHVNETQQPAPAPAGYDYDEEPF